MKTYFAKYLPVDGEILEGDITFKKMRDGSYIMGTRVPEHDPEWLERTRIDGHIPIRWNNGGTWYIHPKHLKKHKLFLCSRDICVGDTVIDNVGRVWENIEKCFLKVIREGNDHLSNDPSWELGSGFKIIGEVSVYADWVVEGDVFVAEGNECEVFPLHTHDLDGSIIYQDFDGNTVDMPVYRIKNKENGHWY